MNRRKVKKKRKLTFESKTAGGELKPGSSGHIGRKLNTGENESRLQLKRDCKHDEARRRRSGSHLSVEAHTRAAFCLRGEALMEDRVEERAGAAKARPSRLTALQEQLIWALLGSGLSRDVLVQAMGELERDRASAERGERGDGESSEEGEMDFPPPIVRELEKLPPEEVAKLRAEVDQLLQ